MKEYKVQMFRHEKWQMGAIPFVGGIAVTNSLESARKAIKKAKEAWAAYENVSPNYKKERDEPKAWRILCRNVSPWVEYKTGARKPRQKGGNA